MNYQTWERLLIAFMVVVLTSVRSALAAGGIATDGTVGPAQTLSGTNVTIPQTVGSTVGKNLFHSFSQFNVNTGQTVTFTENTTNTLDNVVSRVTGASSSDINGTLQSTPGGHANFYLINPAGVVFGQGAQVNVPGAFHVSTADELRFKDGNKFSATHPETSTLTAAAPASFGFLGTSAANNGLLKINNAQLQTASGQTMDMVGGKITVENDAKLSAPSGEIRLVAKQGAGDVSVEPNSEGNLPLPPDIPSPANAGEINIQDTTLEAKGDGGGRVAVWGGKVTVKAGGKIDTSPLLGDAGAITVRASALTIDGQDQPSGTRGINAGAFFGDGGTVDLTSTGAMTISNGANIDASSTIGNGGTVNITSGGTMSISNGAIISTSTFLESGNAGTVKLHAGSLIIDGQGKITGIASTAGRNGRAGVIEGDVDGDMSITNGASITTTAFGAGPAGSVDLTSKGAMNISNGASISSSARGDGPGGSVNLTSKGAMNISDEAGVSTDTFGKGNAGTVKVNAGSLTIDGQGRPTGIGTSPTGNGRAGTVNITVDGALEITNHGLINAGSLGTGPAGSVNVHASVLTMENFAFIFAGTDVMSGQTGDVNVTATRSLTLGNNSSITIENAAHVADHSTIRPGTITVTAPDIELNDSKITTESSGNVAAGNIVVNAPHSLLLDPSSIETTATTGNGGSITINGGDWVYLNNSVFRTSVTGAQSNGGNITVTADNLILNTGLIQANAVGGSGGDISLHLGSLIPSGSTLTLGGSTPVSWRPFVFGLNVIQAAAPSGLSGTIQSTAPQLNLSGVLANLGGPQFDTGPISQDYCALGAGSSLTRQGSGGLPPRSSDLIVDGF